MATSRLNLFQPAYGTQADIETAVNDNLDIIDGAAGAQVYTASTLPASGTFSGKMVWNSTYTATMVWNGTAWRYSSPPVASSLSSVTTGVFTGLLGVQTSDNTLNRYSGSAWVNVSPQASAIPGQGASYSRAATQSAANNTDVFVQFDTTDASTTYITLTNSSTLTINVTGWYTLTGQARWADNNTGRRDVHIVNGANTNIRYASCRVPATQNGATGTGTGEPNAAANAYLTAGTTIRLMTNQNSGGALNLEAAAFGPRSRLTLLYGGA